MKTATDELNRLDGLTTVFRRTVLIVAREAMNDNDPFVGEFEKAAGTETCQSFGGPFGELARLRQSGKFLEPKD